MRRVLLATATLIVVACDGHGRVLAPIRLEPIATFGAESGDGAIATEPRISARHRGGFRIVIPGAGGVATLPLIFSEAGEFLGMLRGGPSAAEQFRAPLFARIGPADSIWVFDGAQRVLVFGPDRGYVRTAQLPVSPWDALVLPDGRMLVAPANADRPLPLLLLSASGDSVGSFGGDDSMAIVPHTPRWLIRDADGSFWSMPMQFRWRLEHWDSNGTRISVVERHPDWFPPYTRLVTPDQEHAPQPTIRGAWIDRGRLWVLGMAADPNWTAGLSSHHSASPSAVIADPDKVYDTILEAIDLRTGNQVTVSRLKSAYPSEVEPGVIMHVRQTPAGWKRAELMRVVLK